jgi:UTP--glucose-1-phosphate uridylyltransferase
VFPAAGLGTRFLPATKAQPKEMLPLVDKPIIQYGVEEAAASGIETVIIVTGRGKNAIEDHFDVSVELETFLQARGRADLLVEIRKISSQMSLAYVRQGEPLGLGHAVLAARALVDDEAFAVVLADDVIDATRPALQQMIDVYMRVQQPVLAVQRVPTSEISQYGVIRVDSGEPLGDGLHRVCEMVEKPTPEEAPSDLAIVGRYILTPDIFELLEETPPDRTGEIQLTDALRRLLPRQPVCAYEFAGIRHDTGNKLGYLRAIVHFALQRPELAKPFGEYLRSLDLPLGQPGLGNDHSLSPAPRPI